MKFLQVPIMGRNGYEVGKESLPESTNTFKN
jgi:hypothetical protein